METITGGLQVPGLQDAIAQFTGTSSPSDSKP